MIMAVLAAPIVERRPYPRTVQSMSTKGCLAASWVNCLTSWRERMTEGVSLC